MNDIENAIDEDEQDLAEGLRFMDEDDVEEDDSNRLMEKMDTYRLHMALP